MIAADAALPVRPASPAEVASPDRGGAAAGNASVAGPPGGFAGVLAALAAPVAVAPMPATVAAGPAPARGVAAIACSCGSGDPALAPNGVVAADPATGATVDAVPGEAGQAAANRATMAAAPLPPAAPPPPPASAAAERGDTLRSMVLIARLAPADAIAVPPLRDAVSPRAIFGRRAAGVADEDRDPGVSAAVPPAIPTAVPAPVPAAVSVAAAPAIAEGPAATDSRLPPGDAAPPTAEAWAPAAVAPATDTLVAATVAPAAGALALAQAVLLHRNGAPSVSRPEGRPLPADDVRGPAPEAIDLGRPASALPPAPAVPPPWPAQAAADGASPPSVPLPVRLPEAADGHRAGLPVRRLPVADPGDGRGAPGGSGLAPTPVAMPAARIAASAPPALPAGDQTTLAGAGGPDQPSDRPGLAISTERLGEVAVSVEAQGRDVRVRLGVDTAVQGLVDAGSSRLAADLAADGLRLQSFTAGGGFDGGASARQQRSQPPVPATVPRRISATRAAADPVIERYA